MSNYWEPPTTTPPPTYQGAGGSNVYDQVLQLLQKYGLWKPGSNFTFGNDLVGVPAPQNWEQAQTWKLPAGFDPGGVWNADKGRPGTVLPEWLRGLAAKAPGFNEQERQLAYNHYVLGQGVAPAFQSSQAQMPADVKAELSRLLGFPPPQ